MKNKLIIVEGIDSTGKTSLCKSIAHHREKKPILFHCTASPSMFEALHDYHMNIAKFVRMNLELGHDVVLDRFWPSEVAYGKVFRSLSDYQHRVDRIKDEIRNLDVIYIHCHDVGSMKRYFQDKKPDPAHQLSSNDFTNIESNYIMLFSSMLHNKPVNHKIVNYDMITNGIAGELQKFINTLFADESSS